MLGIVAIVIGLFSAGSLGCLGAIAGIIGIITGIQGKRIRNSKDLQKPRLCVQLLEQFYAY